MQPLKPPITPPWRLVGTSLNYEEAKRIADNFKKQGFEVKIEEVSRTEITIYRIWVKKEKAYYQR